MGINRSFTATCDYCDTEFPGEANYSCDLKEGMAKEGWKVSNRLSCPTCCAITSHELAGAFRSATPAEKKEITQWVQQQLAKEAK